MNGGSGDESGGNAIAGFMVGIYRAITAATLVGVASVIWSMNNAVTELKSTVGFTQITALKIENRVERDAMEQDARMSRIEQALWSSGILTAPAAGPSMRPPAPPRQPAYSTPGGN